MSRFFCDADCELDYRVIDELGITLIQMPYTIGGEEHLFDCGRTTDYATFYGAMRAGAAAKTQALNDYDYMQYFEPVFAAGEDAIYVSFSHKMSGTFEALNRALSELYDKYPDRKCTIVDTKSISMGAGLIVYYAAKLHNDGASDEEVTKFVENFRNKVRVYFTVDDLVYLKRGGRISSFKAGVGNLLNIKPMIGIKDGALLNVDSVKGRKKAINTLINYLEKEDYDCSYPIVILQADCEEDGENFKQSILEKYENATIWSYAIGPVVGSHCGPNTVGLIFVGKEDKG